eukprot:Blabericola_migrator_1__1042@NODE_1265_length_4943_cov_40_633101_g403_i1_p1_GENE_NODE_1265_length_4943_cov_40_633101_g403_i1NODE_1265_length_4943_cov_40_633101_g403_i1_p1_ORF_typecomplete_len950_score159_51HEAT_2/PF13646_6/5_9e03HEAT_2/PF13646_6/0_049_NODE_1265_length_4943_cov_40_633101_g403_i13413190
MEDVIILEDEDGLEELSSVSSLGSEPLATAPQVLQNHLNAANIVTDVLCAVERYAELGAEQRRQHLLVLTSEIKKLRDFLAQSIEVEQRPTTPAPPPDEVESPPKPAVNSRRKRKRAADTGHADTQSMGMKADLKLTNLCSIITALQKCVGIVSGVCGAFMTNVTYRTGHLAATECARERLRAVELSESVLEVASYLLPVSAQLYDESLLARTNIKRVKRNPQERFNQTGEMTVSNLSPKAEDSSGRMAFDNTPFQIIRCLYHLLMGVAESAASSLLIFVDDWEEIIRCRAFRAITTLWDPSELLCPGGVWKAVDFGQSQLAPLRQWTWLHTGFTRMTGAAAMSFGADQPSYFAPVNADKEQFVGMDHVSAAMQKKLLNARIKSKYHIDEAFHFLSNVAPDGPTFHSRLKQLTVRASTLEVYQPEPGWLIRGLEDECDDVRVEASHFLYLSFKHDNTSLQYKDRFNLPLVDLLWDSSDVIRSKAADSLVLLSLQQPFKDGAYKRFASLLCAKKGHMKRTGLLLLTQCVALNTQALLEALRGLLQAAQEISLHSRTDTASLHECVIGALNLVNSNKDSGVLEMIELTKQFTTEHAELLASTRELADPYLVVLLMFGFCAMQLNPSAGLSTLGPSVLRHYRTLQQRYPTHLTLDLATIPASTSPLVLRSAADVVKGYAVGSFEGLACDPGLVRKYIGAKLISLESPLKTTDTPTEGVEVTMPIRVDPSSLHNQSLVLFLNDPSKPASLLRSERQAPVGGTYEHTATLSRSETVLDLPRNKGCRMPGTPVSPYVIAPPLNKQEECLSFSTRSSSINVQQASWQHPAVLSLKVEGSAQQIKCSKLGDLDWRIDCLQQGSADRLALRLSCSYGSLICTAGCCDGESLKFVKQDEEPILHLSLRSTPSGPVLLEVPLINKIPQDILLDCLRTPALPKLCSVYCQLQQRTQDKLLS